MYSFPNNLFLFVTEFTMLQTLKWTARFVVPLILSPLIQQFVPIDTIIIISFTYRGGFFFYFYFFFAIGLRFFCYWFAIRLPSFIQSFFPCFSAHLRNLDTLVDTWLYHFP